MEHKQYIKNTLCNNKFEKKITEVLNKWYSYLSC